MKNDWHLRKELTIGVIILFIGWIISSVYTWANLENTVQNNSFAIAENKSEVVVMSDKLDSIYEGLLSNGIIKPIK